MTKTEKITGTAALAVILTAALWGCKPSQEKPSHPTTENSALLLGQTTEQKVLDRFLGDWSCKTIRYTPGANPEEKHLTGKVSYVRILNGRFVQETGADSDGNNMIGFSTYDEQRKCYRMWNFGSDYGGPDASCNGKWNEATRTLDWAVTSSEG